MRLLAANTGVMLVKPAALTIPWSSLGISGKSYCRPPHRQLVHRHATPPGHACCCVSFGVTSLRITQCRNALQGNALELSSCQMQNCVGSTLQQHHDPAAMLPWPIQQSANNRYHASSIDGPCPGAMREATHLLHVVTKRLAPLMVQPSPGGAHISHLALVDVLQGLPL